MSSECPTEGARVATSADREVLSELRAHARATIDGSRGAAALLGRDHPIPAVDELADAALRGDPEAVVVVGTLDDAVVGFVLADLTTSQRCGRVATIVALWVTPEARGVGVGEAMMNETVMWAQERGCSELDAEALPGDRGTKNFFESHGMVARKISVSRLL